MPSLNIFLISSVISAAEKDTFFIIQASYKSSSLTFCSQYILQAVARTLTPIYSTFSIFCLRTATAGNIPSQQAAERPQLPARSRSARLVCDVLSFSSDFCLFPSVHSIRTGLSACIQADGATVKNFCLLPVFNSRKTEFGYSRLIQAVHDLDDCLYWD